jgi:hypothetical protein
MDSGTYVPERITATKRKEKKTTWADWKVK